MNVKKVIFTGIIVAILGTVFGWLTCGWLFNWVYLIEPISIWKPIAESALWGFGLAGIVTWILFVLVYAILIKAIPGKGLSKGIMFGFLVWLVGTVPGMLSLYLTMTVATEVVVYWTLIGLVKYMLFGLVTAAIYKKG